MRHYANESHHDRFISYGGSSKIKNFSSLEETRGLKIYRYSCKKYHYFYFFGDYHTNSLVECYIQEGNKMVNN